MRVIRWLLAMLILAGLGATGVWVGVFADASRIGGGIPLLPPAANTMFARVVFTAGGITCLALLAWGLKLGPDPVQRK